MNAPLVPDLKDWMDARELRAGDVCEAFGVSEQTVAHWRSRGVPDRRRDHVARVMGEWEARKRVSSELGRLILRPSEEQFRQWNRAAISGSRPLTVEDWALRELNEAAERERPVLRVAGAEKEYQVNVIDPAAEAEREANGDGGGLNISGH